MDVAEKAQEGTSKRRGPSRDADRTAICGRQPARVILPRCTCLLICYHSAGSTIQAAQRAGQGVSWIELGYPATV